MNVDNLANGLRHSVGGEKNYAGTRADKISLSQGLHPLNTVTALAKVKIKN